MKTAFRALALLFASSAPLATATVESDWTLEQCFPDNTPFYTYNGNEYIFSRQMYNHICVGYQWGKVLGVNPPFDEEWRGCSKVCVSGYGRGEARGCTSMKPENLVGYNYDCDEAACYW